MVIRIDLGPLSYLRGQLILCIYENEELTDLIDTLIQQTSTVHSNKSSLKGEHCKGVAEYKSPTGEGQS